MNKEEIGFKILELYYTKIYHDYNMSLEQLIQRYKYILDTLWK